MSEIREGTVYKSFEIEGVTFKIYYGYESEGERARGWEPTPIYPDFAKQPQYTKDGIPFTIAYGGPCAQYAPINADADDEWCANCHHFDQREEFIGLCGCPQDRVRKNE